MEEEVKWDVIQGIRQMKFGSIGQGTLYGHWFCSTNVICEWIWSHNEPQNKHKCGPVYIKRKKFCSGGDVKLFKCNESELLRALLSDQKVDFFNFEQKSPCYTLFNVCIERGI